MPVLGYLSGAPRVSTHPAAEAGGARAHVLGVIGGFEYLGWTVNEYIRGDRVPAVVSRRGSERLITQSRAHAIIADLIRMFAGGIYARRAAFPPGEIDWVYERYAAFQMLGRPFQRAGAPWILESQGVGFRAAQEQRRTTGLKQLLRRHEIMAYQQCDLIVCTNDEARQDIIALARIPGEKVFTMPSGVNSDEYDPRKFSPVRIFDGFTIGFSGRLYPWQGVDLLLQAISKVREVDIHAVIIGDGLEFNNLQDLARELGIADRVAFLGHLNMFEVPRYLLGCDLSYVGHRRSKFGHLPYSPIKLFESLSLGVPVLSVDEPQISKFVVSGQTGFVYSPGEVNSLVQALHLGYDRRDRLLEMGLQARKDAIENHSWRGRVEALLEWLQDVHGWDLPQ